MGRLKNKRSAPTFSKPSTILNIDHNKAWKHVRADELEVGDIVANHGVVNYTQVTCREEVLLDLGQPESRELVVEKDTIFFAFAKKG